MRGQKPVSNTFSKSTSNKNTGNVFKRVSQLGHSKLQAATGKDEWR